METQLFNWYQMENVSQENGFSETYWKYIHKFMSRER